MKIYQVVKADYINGGYSVVDFLNREKAIKYFELVKQKMINQYDYYKLFDDHFIIFDDPKNSLAKYDSDNSAAGVSLSIDVNEIIK